MPKNSNPFAGHVFGGSGATPKKRRSILYSGTCGSSPTSASATSSSLSTRTASEESCSGNNCKTRSATAASLAMLPWPRWTLQLSRRIWSSIESEIGRQLRGLPYSCRSIGCSASIIFLRSHFGWNRRGRVRALGAEACDTCVRNCMRCERDVAEVSMSLPVEASLDSGTCVHHHVLAKVTGSWKRMSMALDR